MNKKLELGGDYYHRAYFNEKDPFHIYHKFRYDYVQKQIKPNSTVLDVGCGSGVLSHLLSQKGCKVTGVDIDKNRVNFCKKEYPYITFLQEDILKLNLKERFDYVVCLDTLEHLNNIEIAVKNLKKHMKINGSLIVGVPTRIYLTLEPIFNFIKKLKHPNEGFDNIGTHHYVKKSVFTKNGLKIIKNKVICFGIERHIEYVISKV